MSAAALVTIAAAVVVILVLAGFLLAIMRVLVDVNQRLRTIVGAIGTLSSKTEPIDSLVGSIDSNLASASDTLNGLLESKVGAGGAAQLAASVDPLAEARAESRPLSTSPGAPSAQPQPSPPVNPSAGSIRLRDDDEEAPGAEPVAREPGAPPAEPQR